MQAASFEHRHLLYSNQALFWGSCGSRERGSISLQKPVRENFVRSTATSGLFPQATLLLLIDF